MQVNSTSELPAFMKKYFWDVDVSTIHVHDHSAYVIDRILSFGNIPSLSWLWKTYSIESIQQRVATSRQLSKKDKNFFEHILKEVKQEKEASS
jgi:hypothetical protein